MLLFLWPRLYPGHLVLVSHQYNLLVQRITLVFNHVQVQTVRRSHPTGVLVVTPTRCERPLSTWRVSDSDKQLVFYSEDFLSRPTLCRTCVISVTFVSLDALYLIGILFLFSVSTMEWTDITLIYILISCLYFSPLLPQHPSCYVFNLSFILVHHFLTVNVSLLGGLDHLLSSDTRPSVSQNKRQPQVVREEVIPTGIPLHWFYTARDQGK